MQVRGKAMYLSGRNGVLGNRVIAGTAGDRPHTVKYYVHFPFAILSQRIHRLFYGRQIRLSILRKEVNIGILPSQTTFLTMVRSRRRFSSSVAESTALAKDSIIS